MIVRLSASPEQRVLIVMCLGGFLYVNSLGTINVALPTLQEKFDIPLSATQWISIIGVVNLATLSLCFGQLGDMLGRRRIYILGVTLYAVGSGLSAVAFNFPQLLGFRSIMVFGLAMGMPMSSAILAATFSPERRGQALGLYAASNAVGRATGPSIGGLLLELGGWRTIFLTNLFLGLLITLAVFLILRGKEQTRPGSFDIRGAASLIAGYPTLLIAMSLGNSMGWNSPLVVSLFAISAVGLASFVGIEAKVRNPLLQLRFFRTPAFSAAIFCVMANSMVTSPILIFAPIYMQTALGLSALTLGLAISPLPIATLLAAPFSGRLTDRIGPRYIASAGMAVTTLGVILYAQLDQDSSLFTAMVAFAVIGLGAGIFAPSNQAAIFATVGREHYGALAAILISLGTGAGTIGTTIMVAITEGSLEGRRALDPAGFVDAQQLAFTLLIPLVAAATFVSLVGRTRKVAQPASERLNRERH